VSAIPGISRAGIQQPLLGRPKRVRGSGWQPDWRDVCYVAPTETRNHDKPVFLGVLDGTECVSDWNPYEGQTHPLPGRVVRPGYGSPGVQEFPQAAPLQIDAFDRHPDHGQAQLSGASSIAALVPFMDLPHSLPYHYDVGLQIDQGQAIGPRMVFRGPPSYSDQTAAIYAAGF
jgi:hypothetical protein